MSAGEVLEVGTPYALLHETGATTSGANGGHFLSLVNELGPELAAAVKQKVKLTLTPTQTRHDHTVLHAINHAWFCHASLLRHV